MTKFEKQKMQQQQIKQQFALSSSSKKKEDDKPVDEKPGNDGGDGGDGETSSIDQKESTDEKITAAKIPSQAEQSEKSISELPLETDEKKAKREAYDEGEYKEKPITTPDNIIKEEEKESERNTEESLLDNDIPELGKEISSLDDNKLEKKKREAYDEGEYKEKSKDLTSTEDDITSLNKEDYVQGNNIIQLDVPNSDVERKRNPYDEGDYSSPKKDFLSVADKMDPAEMKDFDPSKREKFDDELSETESVSGDSTSSGKTVIEVTSVEEISTKKQAKKVLNLQRKKLGVDEQVLSTAIGSETSKMNGDMTNGGVSNRLMDGLDEMNPSYQDSKQQQQQQQQPQMNAKELRESNMLSLNVDTGPYPTDEPLIKKFNLPKSKLQQQQDYRDDESASLIKKHAEVSRLKPFSQQNQSTTG